MQTKKIKVAINDSSLENKTKFLNVRKKWGSGTDLKVEYWCNTSCLKDRGLYKREQTDQESPAQSCIFRSRDVKCKVEMKEDNEA